jgi:hypothetical protein
MARQPSRCVEAIKKKRVDSTGDGSNGSPAAAAAFSVHGLSVRPHPRHGHEVRLRSPPIEFDSELPPVAADFSSVSSLCVCVCVCVCVFDLPCGHRCHTKRCCSRSDCHSSCCQCCERIPPRVTPTYPGSPCVILQAIVRQCPLPLLTAAAGRSCSVAVLSLSLSLSLAHSL